jgi:hypothetical protein
MYKSTNKSRFRHKTLIGCIGIIILLLLSLLVLEKTGVINLYEKAPDVTSQTPQDEINYRPSSEEEIQVAEDNKQKLAEEQMQQNQTPPQEPSSTQKVSVTPVFGYIEIREEQVRANGFISSVIEEGGTCTLKLKKGEQSAQTTSTSLADAQSTVCGLMTISTGQLSTGEWSAVLSYSSDKYEGVSEERLITVK